MIIFFVIIPCNNTVRSRPCMILVRTCTVYTSTTTTTTTRNPVVFCSSIFSLSALIVILSLPSSSSSSSSSFLSSAFLPSCRFNIITGASSSSSASAASASSPPVPGHCIFFPGWVISRTSVQTSSSCIFSTPSAAPWSRLSAAVEYPESDPCNTISSPSPGYFCTAR